jgi:hypothetical protein
VIQYTITGDKEAIARLSLMAAATEAAAELGAELGYSLPYAYGINYGVDRTGRLRRRVGGAFMLENAQEAILSELTSRLDENLYNGPTETRRAILGAFREGYQVAAARTPVRTGALRDDLRIILTGE